MPSRWEVLLAGPADAAIPLTAPMAIVSDWLDDRDQSANRPHAERPRSGHYAQMRPWSCGPIHTQPAARDGHQPLLSLQVRLLDDSLADRLAAAARPGRRVRLGAREFAIWSEPAMLQQACWQDLRSWTGTRAWQVRFVTPTCFRRGRRTSPWPAPDSLARSLTARWALLDPDTAPPAPGHGTGSVWVSDIDGHSDVHNLRRNARHGREPRRQDELVSGFTGRIRYVCDQGTDGEAAAFDAVLALAAFAGAGSHTTYGFGVIEPEPTWQPPTAKTLRP